MNKEFKDRLFEARKARRLSQAELGKLVGVDRFTISLWENGRVKPSMESLVRLVAALQTTSDYLLGFQLLDNFPVSGLYKHQKKLVWDLIKQLEYANRTRAEIERLERES